MIFTCVQSQRDLKWAGLANWCCFELIQNFSFVSQIVLAHIQKQPILILGLWSWELDCCDYNKLALYFHCSLGWWFVMRHNAHLRCTHISSTYSARSRFLKEPIGAMGLHFWLDQFTFRWNYLIYAKSFDRFPFLGHSFVLVPNLMVSKMHQHVYKQNQVYQKLNLLIAYFLPFYYIFLNLIQIDV